MQNPWISPQLAKKALESLPDSFNREKLANELWGGKPIESSYSGWSIVTSFTVFYGMFTHSRNVFILENRWSGFLSASLHLVSEIFLIQKTFLRSKIRLWTIL